MPELITCSLADTPSTPAVGITDEKLRRALTPTEANRERSPVLGGAVHRPSYVSPWLRKTLGRTQDGDLNQRCPLCKDIIVFGEEKEFWGKGDWSNIIHDANRYGGPEALVHAMLVRWNQDHSAVTAQCWRSVSQPGLPHHGEGSTLDEQGYRSLMNGLVEEHLVSAHGVTQEQLIRVVRPIEEYLCSR